MQIFTCRSPLHLFTFFTLLSTSIFVSALPSESQLTGSSVRLSVPDVDGGRTPDGHVADLNLEKRSQQQKQNGKSWLGSLKAPTYSAFVGADRKSKSFPWGSRTALASDMYGDIPDTGITRQYNFVIERSSLAPDGVERPMILVNGAYPGPTIEANWGDRIEVTVVNKISNPEEGTALHWHGFLQTDTPYMDGIPGITQCPIAPGQTFTYSFIADLYGTSWWHGHYSAQYAAGIFGAMIIHGPTDNAQYDVDLGPILLSDYYHSSYRDLVSATMNTDLKVALFKSDNNLINGKGFFNCQSSPNTSNCDPNAVLSKFSFQSGKSYRLRLINSGADGVQKFSIDNHSLKIIAYDFIPIIPYDTKFVTLAVGQRADVVVTATGSASDRVWMRSTLTSCSSANQHNALAMVYYDTADQSVEPTSTGWIDNTDPCSNDNLSLSRPYYPITPPAVADLEIEIDVAIIKNATGHYVWTMNNSTFRTDYNNPILALATGQQQQGNSSMTSDPSTFPPEWNTYDLGSHKAIRITFNNLTPGAHPMHIHGHNMYILSSTTNTSTSSQTSYPNLDLINPTRRDTHILPPKGRIIIQIDGGNAGVWPFHCHIAWHVSAGLYINLFEDGNAMKQMKIPDDVNGLCKSWAEYTSTEMVDMIDSGLKEI